MESVVRGRKKRVSKNKTAWRKHSDINDIEDFLLDDQWLQLRTGGLVADKTYDSLLNVDKQNDNGVEAPVANKRKKDLKSLKIDQIIAGETTVKPVTGHASPMESGKGNDAEEKDTKKEEGEHYAQVTGKTRVKVPLRTQTHVKTPSILPKKEVIHPGGSYNPMFEDHQQLLQQAVRTELEGQGREEVKKRSSTKKSASMFSWGRRLLVCNSVILHSNEDHGSWISKQKRKNLHHCKRGYLK
ncbi:LOW QUALITY PROTEIN: uncharacterized protein LOC144859896 [Branchiostoma floridae x Branchiostoma japonicum]